MNHPAPNEALVELVGILGEDDTKDLVRSFLHDFSPSIRRITMGDKDSQRRTVHSLKSTARHMGCLALSRKMAMYETRMMDAGAELTTDDIIAIVEEFEKAAPPLRAFVGK